VFKGVYPTKSLEQAHPQLKVRRRRRRERGDVGIEGVENGEGVFPSRLGGLGKRRELPQRGLGPSPGEKRI